MSGDLWVAWLGAPPHTPWDLILTNMPAAAAAWEGLIRLSSRLGFLGPPSHLQPLDDSPSSIASPYLSDKCLPSTDQLDLKWGGAAFLLCCGLYRSPGLLTKYPPAFQNALTHSPDPMLGQAPSVQAQCSWCWGKECILESFFKKKM